MRRRLFISIGLIVFLSIVMGMVVVLTTDRDPATTPTASPEGVAVVATDTANSPDTSDPSNADEDDNAEVAVVEVASETPVPPTLQATPVDPDPHAGFITPTQEPTVPPPPSEPVAEQAVIVFASQTTDEQRADYLASVGGQVTQNIGNLNTVVVNVAPEALPPSSIVRASTADYYVTALNIDYASDPYYPDQWGLRVVGVPEAWMLLPDVPISVTVAVIDSGVCLDHPDLAGHILPGYDYVDDDTNPDDPFGHGCSVAGIIAASTDNNTGIAGIAPHAQILPLRVLDSNGVGTYSDVAAAIVEATDRGAQVINLSLGGVNASPIMQDAVHYATERGVMVVAAAGNNGMEQVFYPAAYEPAIAVGSIDPDLRISSFSNYGPELDVLAPGRDIMTTALNGSYARRSGTSFAAPYVSGAAALAQATGITLSFDGGILSLQTDEPPDEFTPTPTLEPTIAPTQVSEPELFMRNPAAIYCIDLGYSYETRTTDDGEMGVCVLPDETECEQWDFLAGTCGETYSYCATQGLSLETRSDGMDNFSPVYAVCVDENGLDVGSVSDLSALDLRAVGCEDDACVEARQQVQAQMDSATALADDPTIDDVDAQSLPSSFDWRNEEGQNWLTNVRNQSSCGSCWAFSTVGSLESVYNISRGNHTIDLDLSEQHLVSDCCNAGDCGGGWPVSAMGFVRDNGITTESCLSYTASNASCNAVCDNGSSMASTLHTTERVITGNASEMKSALLAHGPLNVYIGMVGSFDHNNVYRCENDDYMNHAVVLVGYNDAGGYWIIRNSWGSNYNGDGYFRLGYDECDIDGIGYSTIAYMPVPPSIVSPGNGATVGSQVTFQWNSTVPIRNGYDLRISQSSNPESGSYLVNASLGENTTSYTYNFNSGGTYYWHLRVRTASFNSAWVTRSLTVDSSFCGQVTQIPSSECNALASFYDQMNGANWTNNNGWGQTITPCDWHGVTCSGGHVTGISLAYNDLTGAIPEVLQDLTYLQTLWIPGNTLSGGVPSWLGNMTSLRELEISENGLTGEIPYQIGNLTGLTRLGLGRNELTGTIPWQIGNLTNLTYLGLSHNNLEGNIPSHLGNLTTTSLYYLHGNQLTGEIPASFENLNPSWLSLAYNQLSGAVPSWMGYEGYYYLNLSGNNFTSLPSSFSNLTSTRWLFLNDMDLGNMYSGNFPSWLSSLTSLEFLQLRGNSIGGTLPTWFGNFTNLKGLDLSYNNLSGTLPYQLSYLTNLQYYLYLNNNHFTGAIPTWISYFTTLEELNLSNNQFDGAIPSQIGNMTALTNLQMSHNLLSGEVPYNITYLNNLNYLDIGYNWLYANNTTTHNFLDLEDPDWEATQGTIPGNDLYYNATDIGDTFPVTLTQDIYGSSVAGNDPTMCVPGYSNTVWYVYTPQENSQIRIDTTDSTYDTVLAVYTGSPSLWSQVACDDDSAGNRKSLVEFSAYVGVTYYIMVADYGTYVETTNTALTLHIASDNTPPEVNILSPLSGTPLNQDTITIEAETSLDATGVDFWVWLDPDLTGPSALADDDKPAVPTAPPPDADAVSAQDAGWLFIGAGTSTTSGRWSITWDASGVADQWVNVWARAYKGSTEGNDSENGLPLDRTDPDGNITAPLNGSVQSSPLVTISANASDNVSGVSHVMFHQRIQITPFQTHWEHLGTDSTSPYAIDWDIQGMAEGWVDIDIRVVDNAGNISPPTTDTVGFTIDPPPANDLITSAQTINVKSLWQMQDILGSTVSFSDPAACAPYVNSVWYTFTEDFERDVELYASGTLDTVMAVYTGTEGNLTQVTCNNDYYGQQSRVAFTAQAGVTYYVMVGKYGSQPVTSATTLYLSGYSPGIHVHNSGELIAALEYANSDADYDHITLSPGNYDFATPYDEFNALPTIDTVITIDGNGQTIRRTGSAEYRLFNVGEAGSLHLYNIALRNGYFSGSEGGAIRNQGYVSLSRATLQNNTAYWGGGVTNWGTLIIEDSNLFDNRAWNGGGAIDNPGTLVRITGSYIGGNQADWGAGVVSWGTLDVYTTRFSDNEAGYGGGAIRTYGTASINWSVINNNRANSWGGGISVYNGNTTVNGVTFSANNAFYGAAIHNIIPIVTSAQGIPNEYPGGPDGRAINAAHTDPVHTDRQPEPAVYANVRPSVGIYNSTFLGNFGTYGGAIYNYNGDVSLSYPTFRDNFATHEGGAVFNTLYSNMDMFGPVLEDNSAHFSAGAIANSATLNLFTPTIRNNEARLYNGGAIVNFADLVIDGGAFNDNHAGDSGGAIYNAAQLSVDSTTFQDNSAYYNGGAIVSTRFNATATINNATFEQNNTGYNGGAISNQDSALTINGSQFIANTTGYDGGAIQVFTRFDNGTFDIDGSHFTGNSANYGGAIHYHTDSYQSSSVDISGSIFHDNIGRMDGGALYTAAPLTMFGSCIANNSDTAVVNSTTLPINVTQNWWGVPVGPSYYSNFGDSLAGPAMYIPYITTQPATCDNVADADLSFEMTTNEQIVIAGDAVNVLFSVTNLATIEAPNVTLRVALSPEVTHTSLPPGCSADGAVIRCQLGTLPAGGSTGLTLRLQVEATAVITQSIQAHVSSSIADLFLENNNATQTIDVIAVDDLLLTEQDIYASFQDAIQHRASDINFVLVDVTPQYIEATIRTRSAGSGTVYMNLTSFESHLMTLEITGIQAFTPAQQATYEGVIRRELPSMFTHALSYGVFDLHGNVGTITDITLAEPGMIVTLIP